MPQWPYVTRLPLSFVVPCDGKVCRNGGILNTKTCQCSCSYPYTGDVCETGKSRNAMTLRPSRQGARKRYRPRSLVWRAAGCWRRKVRFAMSATLGQELRFPRPSYRYRMFRAAEDFGQKLMGYIVLLIIHIRQCVNIMFRRHHTQWEITWQSSLWFHISVGQCPVRCDWTRPTADASGSQSSVPSALSVVDA